MAISNYLSRPIYKLHEDNQEDFSGTYKLLIANTDMPSPTSPANSIDSTTNEDAAQTFIMGIKTSEAKAIVGNYDKDKFKELSAIGNKKCDIIQLYGNDGVGGDGKFVYVGQISPTVDSYSGYDQVVKMTVTVVPNTVPEFIDDEYTIVDNEDGTFTVSKKS